MGVFVEPYVSFRIESQFRDQSDATKNRMFNPMTFTESACIAKVFIQEEKRELSTRLGFGFRQHTDRDMLIDPVNDVRETQSSNDSGILSVTNFKIPLA